MKLKYLNIVLCWFFLINAHECPKLSVIIVIDQFAYDELQKLLPFLQGGIKYLHDHGTRYVNAFYPHGGTVTAAGHAALSTGALPRDHGFIDNTWYTPEGQKVNCDDDSAQRAAVFAPDGLYDFGKSAQHLMVDTLSDQLVLASSPHAQFTVYSLSLKSRSAIAMAGRLGKAIWFDNKTGFFTSSKAYFKELPNWLKQFNKKEHILKTDTWQLTYDKKSPAYNFPYINDYRFAEGHASIINVPFTIDTTIKTPYEFFEKTPQANQLLLNCATTIIDTTLTQNPHDHVVLWLSLSSLDKVGHQFGPHSLEVIDMIYHMDQQLGKFIQNIYKKVAPKDVLFALTADHGVHPIPEILQEQGIDFVRRIDRKTLTSALEQALTPEYDIQHTIKINDPFVYINQPFLDKQIKKELLYDIKNLLKDYNGIKDAWTSHELKKRTFAESDPRNFLKNQLYRHRSSKVIIQLQPYTCISKRKFGTGHSVPYNYDTHVPLIVYHPGSTNKTITERVYIQQLAPTLAYIFNVPAPSATTFNLLPGI